MGFLGTADQMVLFPVQSIQDGSHARWQPAAILEKLIDHISATGHPGIQRLAYWIVPNMVKRLKCKYYRCKK